MVEKRTFVFVILTTIVWASLASAFAGYYYIQNMNNTGQLGDTQNSLNKVASNYDGAANKYDLLTSEYGSIWGLWDSYKYNPNSNYTTLMPSLRSLITHFGKNYTDLFAQEEMNKTFSKLLDDYNVLQEGNVTRDNLGYLLTEYYALFNLAAFRELGFSISQAATMSVSIVIDYGNGTVEWHNGTRASAGYTLFRLTRETAIINYTYWLTEPGHIEVTSINGKAKYNDPSKTWGYYWGWYYWNADQKTWTYGPVGCDAWLLKDGGIYKWNYEYWHFP